MSKHNHLTAIGSKYFVPIIIVFLVSACSLWRDFTTYFNTYYNAKTLFEETEEAILNVPKPLFAFKEDKISQKLQQDLDKVIEKCSKIMQFETESAYFDNALYMTGKSFFYQQSYLKALRKFLELSALEDTDLTLDSKFWIGKTRFQLREYEDAYSIMEEVKQEALKEDREDLYINSFIQQIRYLIYDEQFSKAIKESEALVEVSDSDEMRAEIYYELGKLYLTLEDNENAARAFQEATQYSPTFDIEFNSRLELAKIKKSESLFDESLELFQEIKNENKFSDSLGVVELEIADIYYKRNEIDRAFELYQLIDTAYVQDRSSGIARYMCAEILEKSYGLFDSAMGYYAGVMNSSAATTLKNEAKDKNRLLDKYFIYQKNMAELRRRIDYINDPTLFIKDSLAYEEYQRLKTERADSLASANRDSRANMVALTSGTNTNETEKNQTNNKQVVSSSVTQRAAAALQNEEAIYLPLRPTISLDSLHKSIAKEQYDLANLFFTDLNFPDSAKYYYDRVLNDYPDNHYYVKTLYAEGSYYLTEGNQTKADSLFQIIYDNYPDTEVYTEAARQLGKLSTDSETDPAYPVFLDAEQKYFDSKIDSAIAGYLSIYRDYSSSPLAPKALLAAGYIVENDLHNIDSAAVIYEKLKKDYPDSPYFREIGIKLNFYETSSEKELSKEEQAALDSNTSADTEAKEQSSAENEIASAVADSTALADSTSIIQKDSTVVKSDSTKLKVKPEGTIPSSMKNRMKKSKQDTAITADSTFVEQ